MDVKEDTAETREMGTVPPFELCEETGLGAKLPEENSTRAISDAGPRKVFDDNEL